jgi:hypothetical protein
MRGNWEPGGNATPGASDASVMKVRPLSGRAVTRSWGTTAPRLAVSVRSTGVGAATVTDSLILPGESCTSARVASPVATRSPVRDTFEKPSSATSRRYSPGGRLDAANTPSALEMSSRRRPVPTLKTATDAPGSAEPLLSVTTPVNAPDPSCGTAAIRLSQRTMCIDRVYRRLDSQFNPTRIG